MEKAVLIGGLLIVIFFSQTDPDRVERKMEKALKKLVDARTMEVELDGAPGVPMLKGRFRSLDVLIEGLKLEEGGLADLLPIGFVSRPKKEGRIGRVTIRLVATLYRGLMVDEVTVEGHLIRFDLDGSLRQSRLLLVSMEKAHLVAKVRTSAIGQYLSGIAQQTGLERLALRFRFGFAEVEGSWKIGPVSVPFKAEAHLEPTASGGINLILRDARVLQIIPLPQGWLENKIREWNPILSFDLNPLIVSISAVTITPSSVEIKGAIRLPSEATDRSASDLPCSRLRPFSQTVISTPPSPAPVHPIADAVIWF